MDKYFMFIEKQNPSSARIVSEAWLKQFSKKAGEGIISIFAQTAHAGHYINTPQYIIVRVHKA